MKKKTSPLVCLLTDFGSTDPYVGVMKGMMLNFLPHITFVDLTHEIPPHRISLAAFHLHTSFATFPKETLFLCVVDPGVGSHRRILYAEAAGRKFIAPDNGVLSWVLMEHKPDMVIDIQKFKGLKGPISQTFHGRDVMAPVGAQILRGVRPASFGPKIRDWVTLLKPRVEKWGAAWKACVLAVDHFGNLITNLNNNELIPLAKRSKVAFDFGKGKPSIRGIVKSYASVPKGKLCALPGSSSYLEVSVREGNAAQVLQIKEGDPVWVRFRL